MQSTQDFLKETAWCCGGPVRRDLSTTLAARRSAAAACGVHWRRAALLLEASGSSFAGKPERWPVELALDAFSHCSIIVLRTVGVQESPQALRPGASGLGFRRRVYELAFAGSFFCL